MITMLCCVLLFWGTLVPDGQLEGAKAGVVSSLLALPLLLSWLPLLLLLLLPGDRT